MRVAALVGDLLFGSRVKAALEQAGHVVTLTRDTGADADALVVDLTDDDIDVEAIGRSPIPTLGLYAHVRPESRDAALAAGFDVVVPRSRFMREGAALLDALVADDPPVDRSST